MNRFDRLPHIVARTAERRELYRASGEWAHGTLTEHLRDAASRKPGQRWTFLVQGRETVTDLATLAARSEAFAHRLAGVGATPDDVVAIVLPNSPGAFTGFWGAQLAGVSGFPTSMREGEASLRELFARVGVTHVVLAAGDAQRRGWAAALRAEGSLDGVWLADEEGVIRADPDLASPGADGSASNGLPVTEDGVHIVAYTSGSTSEPKIVLHTDGEILAESRSLAQVFGHFGTMLVAAPVGHITGILHLLTLPLIRDGDIVSLDRWTMDAGLEAARRLGAETVAGTSLYFQQMMSIDPEMGGIRGGIAGGGPVAPAIVQRADREAGIRIVRGYGSTEHPTISQSLPTDDVVKRARTDGRLCDGVEVRILDPVSGDLLPPGTAGEIVSRGPDLMAGYLEPERDAEAFTADGWFRTGDVGVIDPEGFLTITDRIKDLIIRGGENISAKEVEDVVHDWDAVDEAVVLGVPDEAYGERAALFVIPRAEADIDLGLLRGFLAETRLEKFKWPEYVVPVSTFPRTPSGKVSKQELRQEWAARDQSAAARF
jgi:acyl-CoA synthetase (AMP-forming)/AMP-acid ligase II